MSASTETLSFALQLDGSMADAQLAKTRASAMSLGGGFGSLTKGLEGVDKAEREVSKGLRGLGGVMGGLSPQVMGVVGGLGDLAGILTGGGLTIGLAAAAFAASKLYEAYKEGAENAKVFDQAIEAMNTTISSRHIGILQTYTKRVDDLTQALRTFGMTSSQILADDLQVQEQTLLASKSNLEKHTKDMARELKAWSMVDPSLRPADKDPEAMLQIYEASKKRLEDVNLTLDGITPKVNEAIAKGLKLDALTGKVAKSAKGGGAASRADNSDAQIAAYNKGMQAEDDLARKADMELMARAQREYQIEEDKRQKILDAEIAWHDKRLEIQQSAARESEAIWRTMAQDISITAFGNAVGAMQEFFDLSISGSKYAAETAAAHFLQSTGNQIVAMGVQNVVKGGLYALDPLTAAAAPGLIAGGLAAIGVGAAMGAGGSALGADVSRRQAAEKRDSSIERDRGNAARERGTGGRSRSSGRSDGGGITINVQYGVSGPPAEDTARMLSERLRLSNRRRFS